MFNKQPFATFNLTIFIFFLIFVSKAQINSISELKVSIFKCKSDTQKVSLLNDLSWQYLLEANYSEAILVSKEAQSLSNEINFKKGLIESYNIQGITRMYQGNYPEALNNHFNALKERESIGDKKGIANSYNNIGIVYGYQKNYLLALKNYSASLEIRKTINDKTGIASSYNNIGIIYDSQGNSTLALQNFTKAMKIYESVNDELHLANLKSNIGILHHNLFNYELALKYFNESKKIYEKLNDKKGLAVSYTNIGAITIDKKGYKIGRELLNKGLALAKKIGSHDDIKTIYLKLSKLDSIEKKTLSAFENYKQFIIYRDSIDNSESKAQTIQAQMNYDFERKQAKIKAEQDKINALNLKDKAKQKLILYFVIAGLLIVFVFTVFIFRSLNLTKKQKHLLDIKNTKLSDANQLIEKQKSIVVEQQKELISSIKYAQRIQHAILTSENYFDDNLKAKNAADYFILHQPKDIVSGDFYWAISHHNNFYLATADCTGHGVPGAFMSLLNINYLYENIVEHGLNNPALILNEQRKKIITALNPNGNENSKDGMDCTLCAFNFENKTLHIAAANNPVWIVRNGDESVDGIARIIEIKPDKMPVGLYNDNTKDFSLQTIQLNSGDIIYTFTDGYADQFGGTKDKKFTYKRLKELLVSNHKLNMTQQKEVFSTEINNWMKDSEQTDDILVIGIKIF